MKRAWVSRTLIGKRVWFLSGTGLLLSVTSAWAVGPTAVVGRHIFYNNSFHDGNNPGIDFGPIAGENNDDGDAIDPSKTPLLHGRGPATFANWTSCTSGITGLIYDFANSSTPPTVDAFYFEDAGRNGDGSVNVWPNAFVVLPGAGVDGSTRVVVTFSAGMLKSTWLRVGIDTSFGLPAWDLHYWGNAAGDTGSVEGMAITVTSVDEQDILNHPWPNPMHPLPGPIPVSWHWNLNKDSAMNATDPLLCRSHFTSVLTAVRIIDKREPASVVGRHVFSNNSYYDGKKIGIDPLPIPGSNNDDADAINTSKFPLLPGDGMATFANWTGILAGLNGLIYDFAATHRDPTPADFEFHHIGKDGTIPPGLGNLVTPAGFVVQDLGGIRRVVMTFGPQAVKNGWLQATIGTGFGLPAPDLHYWGNAVGDCGVGNAPPYVLVNATDEIAIRNAWKPILDPWWTTANNPYDINKDCLINATDQILARNHRTNVFDCVMAITR